MDDNSRLESLESRLSALETELQRLKTVASFSFTSARGAGPLARGEADPAVPVLPPAEHRRSSSISIGPERESKASSGT